MSSIVSSSFCQEALDSLFYFLFFYFEIIFDMIRDRNGGTPLFSQVVTPYLHMPNAEVDWLIFPKRNCCGGNPCYNPCRPRGKRAISFTFSEFRPNRNWQFHSSRSKKKINNFISRFIFVLPAFILIKFQIFFTLLKRRSIFFSFFFFSIFIIPPTLLRPFPSYYAHYFVQLLTSTTTKSLKKRQQQ